MVILGIDPGTTKIGYGVIKSGSRIEFLASGVIGAPVAGSLSRLHAIYKGVTQLIKKYHPGVAAVEKLYFSKNRKTAISVAEARGVILLTLHKNKVRVKEFSPSEIKAAVTGSGRSDKKAVQKIVALSLRLKTPERRDDAADALAIALMAAYDRG